MLLIAQCNALHRAMPFLFESIDDETELLLPDHLLHSDSLVRKLVGEIPEEDWQEVEIIGWLYQFYISEKKDEVIGKVVKSEDIPAATQLFTPNWIVKYMLHNTLGRQWIATYPNSPLKQQMEFYIEPAEQTPDAQAQLDEITPDSLNPEELTLLDPACGSGHILVEAYDLFKAIYQERGYRAKDIPRLILEKNLYGLEIDDRAAQLAAFALTMKARADDRSIFERDVQPQVLSIQESKGLDAQEITEALNQPILYEEPPPSGELFEEIVDEKAPLFSKKTMGVKGGVSQADVARLIELFEHGKTFGSLIRVPQSLDEKLPTIMQRVKHVLAHGGMFERATARSITPLIGQARILCRECQSVLANPPYLNSSAMQPRLKQYLADNFPDTKPDLFSAFVERNCELTSDFGFAGFMTPFVWMFLKSYEKLRRAIVDSRTITSLVHPEYHAFFDSAFVPICSFVLRNHPTGELGEYFDLSSFYGADIQPVKLKEALNNAQCGWRYSLSSHEFSKIPGRPIAYWANDRIRDIFACSTLLADIAEPKQGLATGDNDRFLRFWNEVSIEAIGFGYNNRTEANSSHKRWFPCNKGGPFRKWHGNNDYVVDWHNDGTEIREFRAENGRLRSRPQNMNYYFREGITWSTISSSHASFRHSLPGSVFETKGAMCFVRNATDLFYVLAFLNSRIVNYVLRMYSPTLDYHEGPVGRLPVVEVPEGTRNRISCNAEQAVELAKHDWDSSELSWNFQRIPLLEENSSRHVRIVDANRQCRFQMEERHRKMRTLEEENNSLFIEAYGLQGELPPEVPEDQITLHRPDREEGTKRLISYAIGCMMGRYSLNEPGLIYAHSGNEGFDPKKYETFPADEDGIVPLTEFHWSEDDAAKRLEKFIATAWPAEHLQQNLEFVAESLGPKRGESPRETIRRYLAAGFFKHHMKLYKKRPIYWLFSSGKQYGFQALVYLHRYNEGTLSRMRTEYVVPLLGKMPSRIDQLTDDIAGATSSQHRKRLEKEKTTLTKQLAEVQAYDEKLRHYADQRITLDLDDGVKVNYGKFGDLLAEVKAVTGKKVGSGR
jgi:type II restriction/modification system DNA methylase subunit YeeA